MNAVYDMLQMTRKDYRAVPIAILGFGQEGRSAADFFLSHHASVTVCDEKGQDTFDTSLIASYENKGVTFQWGTCSVPDNTQVVVRSPGIPLDHPSLEALRHTHVEITSVTNIFFDLCPCPVIGVTGTKGKGTTTTLIYEMLQLSGKDAYIGGNIGVSPLSFLSKLTSTSIVILELSSFQLEDLKKSPHCAVVLMTTSEHLDHHHDEPAYIQAKSHITRFQQEQDVVVYASQYLHSREIAEFSRGRKVLCGGGLEDIAYGCTVHEGNILWNDHGTHTVLVSTDAIRLIGKHNWENVCAASATAMVMGVSPKKIRAVVETFPGLPHRLQMIGEYEGVQYIDDSFSTTPETTIAAIDAFVRPKVLILGGSGKQSNFSLLAEKIRQTEGIRAIIGIGEEWQRIKQSLLSDPQYQMRVVRYGHDYAIDPPATIKAHGKTVVEGCMNMHDVIKSVAWLVKPGDVVLLSPGCASFGMFRDYKDRGDQFIQSVYDMHTSA